MTRDEVLSQLDSVANSAFAGSVVSADVCRAAAEIIRAGGWRPMNTAPRDGRDVPVLVKLGGKVEWRQLFASSGGEYWVNHGGGHLYRESECVAWFELPAPPAREVGNDGE